MRATQMERVRCVKLPGQHARCKNGRRRADEFVEMLGGQIKEMEETAKTDIQEYHVLINEKKSEIKDLEAKNSELASQIL